MATYEVTGPDGNTYEVTAPDDASENDVLDYVQKSAGGATGLSFGDVASNIGPAPASSGMSATQRFGQGVRDPFNAGAQLLTHILPQGLVDYGNTLNNMIAKSTGMLAEVPPGGVDEMVRQQEQAYQKPEGVDLARAFGNMLSPPNLIAAAKVPRAASLTGRMAAGAGAGALFGGMQPVTEGEFWPEKGKQVGVGAGVGAATPMVTGAAARLVRPNTSEQAHLLMREGVTPTAGQILGGGFQRAEDKARSLPILGDAITSGQRRAVEQLNRAAIDRTLAPIGEKLPKNMAIGNEAVKYAGDKLSDAYDALLPNLIGRMDQQFRSELGQLKLMAGSLPGAQRNQFKNLVKNEIEDRFTSSGLASGETLKKMESVLGEKIRNYSGSSVGAERDLADAFKEAQAVLRRMIDRANPNEAQRLTAINTGWSNLTRVEDAAGRIGSKEGAFSPAQLRAAVRNQNKTVRKRGFARGDALMQDLADAGENVLGAKYPDSGTFGRAALGAATLGGGYWLHPWIPAAEAATAIPYLPGAQRVTAALLASRPEAAKPVAEAIRQSSPFLLPGLMQPAFGLLE